MFLALYRKTLNILIKQKGQQDVIVYTDVGWEIERETYSDELLEKLRSLIPGEDYSFVNKLKDRNRGMILLLLNKIKKSGEKEFIPLLKVWREIDYRREHKTLSTDNARRSPGMVIIMVVFVLGSRGGEF